MNFNNSPPPGLPLRKGEEQEPPPGLPLRKGEEAE